MAAWRLPSSSSERSGSPGGRGDAAQLAVLEQSPQVRRKRGRPQGGAVAAALAAGAEPVIAVQAADDSLPLALFRKVGSETTQALVEFLHCADVSKLSSDGQRLVGHFFGAAARPVMSRFTEGKILGVSCRTVGRRELVFACALYLLHRSALFSLLSSVFHRQKWAKTVRLVAVFRLMTFDETPLKLRGRTGDSVNVLKVLASKMGVGVVLQHGSDDSYHFFWLDMPMPLQAVDKATGRNLYHALTRFCVRFRTGSGVGDGKCFSH